jgi:hypothetical protein
MATVLGGVSVIALVSASSATPTTDTGTSTASGTITGSLLGGSVLVASATSTTVLESYPGVSI